MRQVLSIRDGKHDVCGQMLDCRFCCVIGLWEAWEMSLLLFVEYCINTVEILIAKEQGVLHPRPFCTSNSPAIASSLCEH